MSNPDTKASSASLGWYSRSYIPHLDAANILQFITIRLADSLPQNQLRSLEIELKESPSTVTIKRRQQIEAWLDAGYGAPLLANPKVACVVASALLEFHKVRYTLHAWVIMPNHIHILIETRPEWPLYRVIGSFKRYTARVANQLLSRTGAFWARDYFDRYIREAEHYTATVCYIENNPVKAGLCREPRAWRCSSAWIDPPLSRTIEL